jgi:hypothetical protein
MDANGVGHLSAERLRGLQVDTSPNLATGHATTTTIRLTEFADERRVRTAINDAPSPSCCPRIRDSASDPLRGGLQQMLVYDRCISGQSSDLLFKIPSLASKWDNLQNDRVAMHRSPYLQRKTFVE